MIPEGAVVAAANSIKHIYPERATQIARKSLAAALPYLLVESWDDGFSKVDGTPAPNDYLYKEQESEVAAKAIYEDSGAEDRWDEIDYQLAWAYREDALLMLAAATPLIPELEEASHLGAHAATTNVGNLNPYKTRPQKESS